MKEKRFFRLSALGVTSCLLLSGGNSIANPTGVPVTGPGPLACDTPSFHVEAITGLQGEFPVSVPCGPGPNYGQSCSDYGYYISSPVGLNIDHTLLAVSAEQDLDHTVPNAFVAEPGDGDSLTNFLEYAEHEYAVRFNSNGTVYEAHIIIVGASAPRISTAYMKSGRKAEESCLIAGAGMTGDPYQPVSQEETALVAGGECQITKYFDAFGKLQDVTVVTSGCWRTNPEKLYVGGQELKNNTSPHGISGGDGTFTCYGPPVPRTPICVCTAPEYINTNDPCYVAP